MVPRALAIRVITQVLTDCKPLDEVLASCMVSSDLTPHSRAWLQDVCSGVLRWKGRLDLAIDSGSLKKKPSGWLRKVLLVGAYQLIVQDRVAAASVVNETVDFVKGKEGEAPARFANALLRKIAEHASIWRELPFIEENAHQWASLPDWFWKKTVQDYGVSWAKEYSLACLKRPQTWLLCQDEGGAHSELFEGEGLVVKKSGFEAGKFIVQDISSQRLVKEVSKIIRGSETPPTALDLCAAPGGKSVALCWEGFQVTATDREETTFSSKMRWQMLRETVQRAAPAVRIVSRAEVDSLSDFALVWVDAPCSGSGIIRRHPDVRWLRQPKDLAALISIQSQLIQEAWGKVRSGGFLMYSVCSVFKEEGRDHFHKNTLAGAKILEQWNFAPHHDPFGDGFFGILLSKV